MLGKTNDRCLRGILWSDTDDTGGVSGNGLGVIILEDELECMVEFLS